MARPLAKIFRTPWGWMGIAATAKGVSAVVLPKFSRRAVENVLVRRLGSRFDVRRSGRATENKSPSSIPEELRASSPEPVLREASRQALEFLAGSRRSFNFPVDLSGGSPFQRQVWRTVLRIPYGQVRPYRWVAVWVGGSRYARAVGLAIGANPVPLAVPCHRVVASARCSGKSNGRPGSLGGFTGGLRLKRKLLALEGSLSQLSEKR